MEQGEEEEEGKAGSSVNDEQHRSVRTQGWPKALIIIIIIIKRRSGINPIPPTVIDRD